MPRQPLFRWPYAGRHLDEAELAELAAELRQANLPADADAAQYQSLLERLRTRLRGPEQPRKADDDR